MLFNICLRYLIKRPYNYKNTPTEARRHDLAALDLDCTGAGTIDGQGGPLKRSLL